MISLRKVFVTMASIPTSSIQQNDGLLFVGPAIWPATPPACSVLACHGLPWPAMMDRRRSQASQAKNHKKEITREPGGRGADMADIEGREASRSSSLLPFPIMKSRRVESGVVLPRTKKNKKL